MSMRSYRDARTLLITIPYRRLLYVGTGTGTGPVLKDRIASVTVTILQSSERLHCRTVQYRLS